METRYPVLRIVHLVLITVLLSLATPRIVAAHSESPPPKNRPWLGVLMQPVTPPLAEAFGLVDPNGVLIGGVKPGGPADKGGIKAGDVIVRFDTHFIRSLDDLPKVIRITPPGKEVEVQVVRDQKMKTLHVTLSTITPPVPEKALATFDAPLGVEVRTITRAMAKELGPQNFAGVMISKIIPGKPAAEAGLQKGDVITEINQKAVSGLEDYIRLAAERDKEVMLFLVRRNGKTMFIGINPSTAQ